MIPGEPSNYLKHLRDLPRPGEHRNRHSALRQLLDPQVAPREAVTHAFGALHQVGARSQPASWIKGNTGVKCDADAIDGTGHGPVRLMV